MSRAPSLAPRIGIAAGAVLGAVALLWVLLGVIPRVAPPRPANPAADYEDALRRFAAMAGDSAGVHPSCHPFLLTHGRKVERVVVLFHGFTNCPMQFRRLAEDIHARGMNVLAPRFPRHGLADRMTEDLSKLTAEELTEAAGAAVDVARGLGDRVSVVGLSSTAVTAAWLAENRPDIDQAILLAPSFAPKGVSATVARHLTGGLLATPNSFAWWNSKAREKVPGPTYCYPRFPTRALAQVYRLGFAVAKEAAARAPAAGRIDVLVAAADEGVNNDVTREITARWREHGARVRAFEFPEWTQVRHDMIDPSQPYERTALSYPPIVALLESAASEVDSARMAPARAWSAQSPQSP